MTEATAVRRPERLGDLPFVYLSYDEPWADEGFADLAAKVPGAIRVHGVRGLDACHKAAAEAAGTEFFVTIDADTTVDAGITRVPVPQALLSDHVRLIWPVRHAVTGQPSGNGSVKLWPRALVMAMRTHEAAPPGTVSMDHEIGDVVPGLTRSVDMPGILGETNPARTPRHAFRAGFREGAYLDRMIGQMVRRFGDGDPRVAATRAVLAIWTSVGRHVPNGLWTIHGARLALWLARTDGGRDPRGVNDYGGLNAMWSDWVLPRFSPGGMVCPLTGDSWDAATLADEVAALGVRLTALGVTGLAEIGATESRMIAAAAPFPARRTSNALDAIGWALVRGTGVAQNPDAARPWFEAAHATGDVAAPLNLSRLSRDPDEARRLIRIALVRGNPWAADHLARLDAQRASAEADAPAPVARAGA
ncbi:MAG: hypothetical protein MUF73_13570 [Rhodobacteraceae bacterium]|nr:hypothetical protein [Paracoccaceae bacterium]